MRPQSLTPLFAQITSLPGIGPRLGKLVERLAGPLVLDLLWHLPFAVIDRRNAPEVAKAKPGEVATLTVTVDEHHVPRNPRQPYRVWCSDETGKLCLTYFNGREEYLKKLLPPGEIRVISGKIELYQGEVQMTHPDHVVPLDERDQILRVEPVYGLTTGLTQRPLQKAIAAAVALAPELPEWQDAAYLKKQKWAGLESRPSCRPMHPASLPISIRCILRARDWPSTNCWRASSRSHWCATTTAPWPAARSAATATSRSARLRRCPSSSRPARLSPLPRLPPTWRRPSAWYGFCRATSAAARRWLPSWPC